MGRPGHYAGRHAPCVRDRMVLDTKPTAKEKVRIEIKTLTKEKEKVHFPSEAVAIALDTKLMV